VAPAHASAITAQPETRNPSTITLLPKRFCLYRSIHKCFGYTNISMTLNRYSHVTPGMQKRAAVTSRRRSKGNTRGPARNARQIRGKKKPRGFAPRGFHVFCLMVPGAGFRGRCADECSAV
jgi:hypothetical protein